MKVKSLCPNCGKAQTIWETSFSWLNRCSFCKGYYKLGREGWKTVVLLGLGIAGISYIAYFVISWKAAVFVFLFFLPIISLMQPYWVDLARARKPQHGLVHQWLLEFFIYHLLTAVLLLVPLGLNVLSLSRRNVKLHEEALSFGSYALSVVLLVSISELLFILKMMARLRKVRGG